MYPDYYIIIKKPIALDKIKSQLDSGEYQSLFAVKNDLDQCFRNAKRYNLKESQIFNDAKFLHVCPLILHSSVILFSRAEIDLKRIRQHDWRH